MQYWHNFFFLIEAVISILVYYRGHFSSCLTWKNLPSCHFSSKMSNYSTAGGGGHYSKNSNKNFILKNDPGQYIFYGRHYSSLHGLEYTNNTRFLCFNNLWMIKYFLYHWWSMSAFYGYIEILGLKVPLKHKNWMSLYLFHGEWISHDFLKTSWPVPQKTLSEPYITFVILSARYLHLIALILFSASLHSGTLLSVVIGY